MLFGLLVEWKSIEMEDGLNISKLFTHPQPEKSGLGKRSRPRWAHTFTLLLLMNFSWTDFHCPLPTGKWTRHHPTPLRRAVILHLCICNSFLILFSLLRKTEQLLLPASWLFSQPPPFLPALPLQVYVISLKASFQNIRIDKDLRAIILVYSLRTFFFFCLGSCIPNNETVPRIYFKSKAKMYPCATSRQINSFQLNPNKNGQMDTDTWFSISLT